MLKAVLCLLLAVQTLASPSLSDSARAALAMKSGVLLRMHVVAQDDTLEMQRVKLRVRDAVRDAYAASPAQEGPMLPRARALLPALTATAKEAALAEGFTGTVSVSIEMREFDARVLDGLTIPAGSYPALMILLGDARGHNWWGLIDPDLALASAAVPDPSQTPVWDWSLAAFLQALFGAIPPVQEESTHE